MGGVHLGGTAIRNPSPRSGGREERVAQRTGGQESQDARNNFPVGYEGLWCREYSLEKASRDTLAHKYCTSDHRKEKRRPDIESRDRG